MSQRRCAVVTGASRGIGRAVAVRLAEEGYDVGFCFRSDQQGAEHTAAAVRAAGARAFAQACDVADAEAVTTFVKAVEAELGPVHALVNSAGIVRDMPLALMSQADWSSVLDTNLTGTFNFCRATVFGFMKRRSGAIVNMSSVAGVYGHAGQANYAAAKAGIIGLSKSLAKELARSNVRVNVVAPGFIETDMTAGIPEKARARALEQVLLRRFGAPEAVAELTAFLLSDRADYITGQTLHVDGGLAL
ncbi:MAG TPA: 3-oxoacyl-[acyl-carrier-protein] reductase [Kineosporiaceae bacterium]|nr:3-oxoacyl-[acyl-carrier-protein] reductase [Kineosporiaceae bacterium]